MFNHWMSRAQREQITVIVERWVLAPFFAVSLALMLILMMSLETAPGL